MADELLFAYTDPGPVPLDEFHDWYDNEHGPARLTVPGFLPGYRFRALDAAPPPWPPGMPPSTSPCCWRYPAGGGSAGTGCCPGPRPRGCRCMTSTPPTCCPPRSTRPPRPRHGGTG